MRPKVTLASNWSLELIEGVYTHVYTAWYVNNIRGVRIKCVCVNIPRELALCTISFCAWKERRGKMPEDEVLHWRNSTHLLSRVQNSEIITCIVPKNRTTESRAATRHTFFLCTSGTSDHCSPLRGGTISSLVPLRPWDGDPSARRLRPSNHFRFNLVPLRPATLPPVLFAPSTPQLQRKHFFAERVMVFFFFFLNILCLT